MEQEPPKPQRDPPPIPDTPKCPVCDSPIYQPSEPVVVHAPCQHTTHLKCYWNCPPNHRSCWTCDPSECEQVVKQTSQEFVRGCFYGTYYPINHLGWQDFDARCSNARRLGRTQMGPPAIHPSDFLQHSSSGNPLSASSGSDTLQHPPSVYQLPTSSVGSTISDAPRSTLLADADLVKTQMAHLTYSLLDRDRVRALRQLIRTRSSYSPEAYISSLLQNGFDFQTIRAEMELMAPGEPLFIAYRSTAGISPGAMLLLGASWPDLLRCGLRASNILRINDSPLLAGSTIHNWFLSALCIPDYLPCSSGANHLMRPEYGEEQTSHLNVTKDDQAIQGHLAPRRTLTINYETVLRDLCANSWKRFVDIGFTPEQLTILGFDFIRIQHSHRVGKEVVDLFLRYIPADVAARDLHLVVATG